MEGQAMTDEQHIEAVREKARALIAALDEATSAGISQAVLLPELVSVFREAGLMP